MDETTRLDHLDRRLVAALQVNPRASWGEIGRALGEHERTVARRLQRLLGLGAVTVTAIYDDLRCGLGTPVHLHIRTDPCGVHDVAGGLTGREDTRSVYAVTGSADVCCELVVPRERLHDVLSREVPSTAGVRETRTQVVMRTFRTVAEWHAPLLRPAEVEAMRATLTPPAPELPEHVELSAAERRIAGLLVADGRIGVTAVADALGVSAPTAGRRLASLLERRVVHLRAEAEPALLGFGVEAQLWLSVRPAGLERVGTALAACPAVRYCAATAGTATMIVQVCVAHEAELYGFITEVVGGLDDVADVSVTLITRAYKRGYLRKIGYMTKEPA
ncbi:Lrp/AsnC family transcriptional regulator [Bailinhaonella thermotolerans]|uniref:Lrp/AsnC family transcriptional regulator n=1 Tax=Bailinhaonella thermotolerans TaxID=1070861 RepID=A0A3A4A473_9ACTN|nr:Lrp/AsnC family transcriptional regulator [Bailinhaonella thermotolerans]RJL21716.1 Lrp/AsnC family transcriptional regulator [Bailinhaonella thermotolerans]